MSRSGKPKFRREAPAKRREDLVAATLQCLRKHGHAGASVRQISAAAGVSPGLINHHFASAATLIAAAYESVALGLLRAIEEHARDAALAPRERLRCFFEASFGPELLDPELFRAWLVFWSLAPHHPEVRAVHRRTWAAYRRTLEVLLRALRGSAGVPPFQLRRAAVGLSALLDGLWLEASLNPQAFRAGEAIALCEQWTDALCSGDIAGAGAAGAQPPAVARARRTRSRLSTSSLLR